MFKSYLDMAIEFFKIDANVFEIGGYGNEVVYGSLSWSVDNAMLVQVSGLGAVDPKESGVRVPINQNETFVLTAIDPITGKILTASQSVTVEPSVPSRWIPSGTILMWSGSVVPPGLPTLRRDERHSRSPQSLHRRRHRAME